MRAGRTAAFLSATTVSASLSVLLAPAASAKTVKDPGMKDCIKQSKAVGLKKSDAQSACSYAKGGNVADCISLVQHESKGNDLIAAESGCRKAGPKHD